MVQLLYEVNSLLYQSGINPDNIRRAEQDDVTGYDALQQA
jgi:hypothetical protein